MCQLLQSVRIFLQREDGPTAVEYAVMLALIITVCFSAVQALGANVKASLTNSNSTCFVGS
jgi:pilus assembly protein Flp/PilA